MAQARPTSPAGPQAVPDADDLLFRFDRAWKTQAPPRIEDFLPSGLAVIDPTRRQLLAELVKMDLECRWRAGLRLPLAGQRSPEPAVLGEGKPKGPGPRLEDYLRRLPELGPIGLVPVELIGEEYWVRHCWGDRPSHDEYLTRFMAQALALRERLRQIDATLTLERDRKGSSPAPAAAAAPVVPPAEAPKAVPPAVSSADLLECLRKHRLVKEAELATLTPDLSRRFADPRSLARELIDRSLLTPYQANQLLQGNGAELTLGSYILLERLGEGGTGQVFKARHQTLNRIVALKLIRKELVTDVSVVNRFYREIQLISQFTHPHLVHALDAGPVGATHLLVMEYVEGVTLDQLVKRSGPLPVNQACDCIRQAALGLQHAHQRGLIHRDVKPSNLLLSPQSKQSALVKVLDLGLARFRQNVDGESTSTMTPSGPVTMGTPDYMAPEQAIDFHGVDVRADIYSLGCTFYFLLTGQPPFSGGALAQKLLRHQQAQPSAVEKIRPDVPAKVAAVLRRMLAKEPADRFQTPGEVARVLASLTGLSNSPAVIQAVAPDDTHARMRMIPPAAWRGSRRSWLVRAAAGLLVILLGVLFRRFVLWPSSSPPSSDDTVSPMGLHSADRFAWLDRLERAKIPASERYPGQPTEVVAVLGEHRGRQWGEVNCLAFGIKGKALVSAGANATHVWDAATLQERATFLLGGCRRAVFTADGQMALAGNNDGIVRGWDLATGKERLTFNKKHTGRVAALACTHDGKTVASGSYDKTIKLWDAATGMERTALAGHEGTVSALAFAPDGRVLASGSLDGTVFLWDVGTGEKKKGPEKASPVNALAYSPDGKVLAIATKDGIALWDLALSKLWPPLRGNTDEVTCLAFSSDSKTLASGSTDGKIRFWDVGRAELRSTPRQHSNKVSSLAFSADAQRLVSGSTDGTIRLWDVADAANVKEVDQENGILSLAPAPDGSGIALGCKDGSVRLWNPATDTTRTFLQHSGAINTLAYSPDSKLLAYATNRTSTVGLLDLGTRRVSTFEKEKLSDVSSLAFSTDGKTVASAGGSHHNIIYLWDVATARRRRALSKNKDLHAFCVALSPDGTMVASGADEAKVWLWDASTGEELGMVREDAGFATTRSLTFSPDSKLLASVNNSLTLWNVVTRQKHWIRRTEGMPLSASFAPDGRTIATSDLDGRIIVWDVNSGNRKQTLELPGAVAHVVWFPDGRHLATVNGNGTAYILRLR